MVDAAAPKQQVAIETNMLGNRAIVPVTFEIDLDKVELPGEVRLSKMDCVARVKKFAATADEARQFDRELAKADSAFSKHNLAQTVIGNGTSAMYPFIALSIKHDDDHKEILKHMMPLIQLAASLSFRKSVTDRPQGLDYQSNETYKDHVYLIDLTMTMDRLEKLDQNIREMELIRDGRNKVFPLGEIYSVIERCKKLANRAEKQLEKGIFNEDETKAMEKKIAALRGQAKRGEEKLENYVTEARQEKRNTINETASIFKRIKDRRFEENWEDEDSDEQKADPERQADKRVWEATLKTLIEAMNAGFNGTVGDELSLNNFKIDFSEQFSPENKDKFKNWLENLAK